MENKTDERRYNKIMETELEAVYDSRNSFYGKAVVRDEIENGDSWLRLFSYNTEVCKINKSKSQAIITYGEYGSQTSFRHIKEFLKQNGFKAESKKQMLKDYGNN